MQSPGMGSGNPDQPYNAPIPPPTGGGSGYGMSSSPQIRFEVIGQAWNIVKDSLGVWIPALLVVSVISILLSQGYMTLVAVTLQNDRPSVGVGILGFVLLLVIFVVSQLMAGGLYRMAINQVRGQAIAVGNVFSATDVLPALLIGTLLTGIAVSVGFALCVIPGLLLQGCLMFTIPLIVDRRMGAIDAMSLSFNTLKSQALMAFLFLLVVGLVASLGMLACGIGVLVSAPIAIVSQALLYNDFFGGNESTQPASFDYSAPPPIPPTV